VCVDAPGIHVPMYLRVYVGMYELTYVWVHRHVE